MKWFSSKTKTWYAKPTFAVLETDDGLKHEWNKLSLDLKKRLDSIVYDLRQFKERPLMYELFMHKDVYLGALLFNMNNKNIARFEIWMRDIEAKGLYVMIISNAIGAKMGGKRNPIIFISKINFHDLWYSRVGILEYVEKLSWAKRLERDKKFLGSYVKFRDAMRTEFLGKINVENSDVDSIIAEYREYMINYEEGMDLSKVEFRNPKIKFVDLLPEGCALANPKYLRLVGEKSAVKLMVVAKETLIPNSGIISLGSYDIFINNEGNKYGLPVDKFEELLGYNPDLTAEKSFSRNLKIKVKTGPDMVGRNPSFGLDFLSYCKIMPDCSGIVETINKVLRWEWDDTLVEKFLMYKDENENKLVLSKLGRKILEPEDGEQGKDLSDPEVRDEILSRLNKYRMMASKERVAGEFGPAAPLSMAPVEVKDQARTSLIVGYSGGFPVKAKVVVHNDLIYVEDSVWIKIGRDFDWDYVFKHHFNQIPDKSVINTVERIEELYQLPDKVKDENDDRDKISTICDVLRQSRLIGIYYNGIMIAEDALRVDGKSNREVCDFRIKEMALLENHIRALKGKAEAKVPTASDLLIKNKYYMALKYADRSTNFFRVGRAKASVVIDDMVYHPLEALVVRAQEADANSFSWWESYVAQFKGLVIPGPLGRKVEKIEKVKKEVPVAPEEVEKVAEKSVINKEKEVKPMKTISITVSIPEVQDVKELIVKGIGIVGGWINRMCPTVGTYRPNPEPVDKSGKMVVRQPKFDGNRKNYWVKVAGVTMEGRQEHIKKMPGEMISGLGIKYEPSERFPDSVAIYIGGVRVGHVPAKGHTNYARIISDKFRKNKNVQILVARKYVGSICHFLRVNVENDA